MERKPEYYPKWLRDMLYDPLAEVRAADPQRNCMTLQRILQTSYRTNSRDALLFDMCIEQERLIIKMQEKGKSSAAYSRNLEDRIATLTDRVALLESKLRGIGDE